MNEVEHIKNKLAPHLRVVRDCKYFRDFKWVAVNRDGMVTIYTQKPLAGLGGCWLENDAIPTLRAPIAEMPVSHDFDWQSAIFSIDEMLEALGRRIDMTEQLRKAALDFLRLAIENPEEHGYYAIDKNGEVYWYKERPYTSPGEEFWKTERGVVNIPNEMQKILLWDSLLFSAEEVASTPVEPPQSAPAPSPKMGPFDMERFKAGEFAYTDMCSTYYRYLGTLSGSGFIACEKVEYPNVGTESLAKIYPYELEQTTKMPVKTRKVYIYLWKYDDGRAYAHQGGPSDCNLGHRNEEMRRTLIEIIEREVEV